MSRGSKMIKTTAIYFVGNFASKLLSFFLLPLYTAYLTTKDFGQVDLFVSTLPLIAPIFTMQVTESLFRFLCTANDFEDKKRSITNSLVIFLGGILVFVLLYMPFVSKFKLTHAALFLMYFVATYIGIFMQQLLRGLQRTNEYAVTGVVATLVQATLNILLIVRFGMGGESLLFSSTAASIVISLIIVYRVKFWKLIDYNLLSKIEIKRQLKYGVPLIPNQICWWGIGLLGKYILFYFHGSSENGILAVASKFSGLLTIITSIFFLAWTENIIREFDSKDRDEYFSSGFQIFMKFTFSITACLLPVIKIYNVMTISGEFIDSWKYVPMFLVGALFNALSAFLGTVYTASMKTTAAFTTTIVAAVTNLVIALLLVPYISIWGVALSNMLSFIILLLLRIKSTNKIISLKIEFTKNLPSLLLLIIAVIVYYYLNTFFQISFFIISSLCALLFNKDVIIAILKVVGIKKK